MAELRLKDGKGTGGGDDAGDALEDGADAGGVELRRAVVVVDAVLLLLDVGNLGVAETDDVGTLPEGVDLVLQNAVEVVEGVDV